MVLVKAAGVNGGAWTPFNIGRNWQGSITHVATADGTLVEEFAYSPWGEESTPDALDTLSVVDVVDFGDMEPVDGSLILPEYPGEGETELNLPEPLNSRLGLSLYVGAHGYTGHEHLWQYGLINCNARIYDPSVGRFLSPDPMVQDPASTQNFNRYSYCLNNPLKYTDESGEIVWLVPVIGAVIGVYIGYNSASKSNVTGWERIGYIAAGAAIGTVASLLASAVAAGISPIIAEAGIGGFAGGAITRSASGLVGGGVSGFGYRILDGGTLEEAFAAGGAGALSGAIVGGIMGGSAEGIKAMKEGRNFWTGELPRPTNNYSSLKLKDDFGIKINEPELLSTNEYPGPPGAIE